MIGYFPCIDWLLSQFPIIKSTVKGDITIYTNLPKQKKIQIPKGNPNT